MKLLLSNGVNVVSKDFGLEKVQGLGEVVFQSHIELFLVFVAVVLHHSGSCHRCLQVTLA